MSSPVLGVDDECAAKDEMKSSNTKQRNKVDWYDTSSVSSAYMSDMESAASTPIEENKQSKKSNKISDLIQSFEAKHNESVKLTNDNPSNPEVDELDTNVRVQKLKEHLQMSLENSFRVSGLCKLISNSDNSESADENRISSDDITDKFTTYVKSVRIYSDLKHRKNNRLFHCCLIVALINREPYIKAKFPKNVEVPHKIEALCFPDGIDGPMDQNCNAQCYSLVITDDKGERTFGYCRRVIPEGFESCLPLAYCILSKHRLPSFYKGVLKELESRHGLSDWLRDNLISKFYYQRVPQPGESVRIDLTKIMQQKHQFEADLQEPDSANAELDLKSHIFVNSKGQYGTISRSQTLDLNKKNAEGTNATSAPVINNLVSKSSTLPGINQSSDSIQEELVLKLPEDTRYEESDLRVLHDKLTLDIVQKIFASLLLERKIILISCVLSTLSSCIEALQSILYPFCWPHTLIPILPKALWEIVEAPTPFVCGVLSSEIVNMHTIENALIVDLESREILQAVGDEHKILPSCLLGIWKDGINVAKSIPRNDIAHLLFLSDAYLRVFIQSCGQYKQFVVDGKFQKETFMKNIKGKGVRRFLKWFTETTMFNAFVETVQKDQSSFKIFDKRIEIYSSQNSSYILEKMKEWTKRPK